MMHRRTAFGLALSAGLAPSILRAQGTWDETRQKQTDTICGYCGVGCTLTLHVQDNTIVKVTSPADQDITRGNLCVKGRFGHESIQNRGDEPELPA